ncbi:glycosyltransferase [Paenibacillus sp. JSM ZJ436]|uniref:glycosyltransferase n=1 Tax=Paenibacillus sp. JSM ZJ436 TaxID=3376190 RepID=UPI0037916CC7
MSRTLSITWEGDFSKTNSLALVNAHIYEQLVEDSRFQLHRFPEDRPDPAEIHISHLWPPRLTRPSGAEYWISILPWEFGAVPVTWYMSMKYDMDEIWVYSQHNKNSYIASGIPGNKIRVLPLAVDPDIFKPEEKEESSASIDTSFRFLYVGGSIARKGFDILLDAYLEEFSPEEPVSLIVKDHGNTTHYHGISMQQRVLDTKDNPQSPQILYTDLHLSSQQLADLYRSCDCAVFPFRGEGFGLPIAEAAACGTAVIVPDQGPASEWLNHDEAIFVPSRLFRHPEAKIGDLATLDEPTWIDIDKKALQAAMRYAFQHRDAIHLKGRLASSNIRSSYTWQQTASLAGRYILDLWSRQFAWCGPSAEQQLRRELAAVSACSQREQEVKAEGLLAALVQRFPHYASLHMQLASKYIAARRFLQAISLLVPITEQASEEGQSRYSDLTDESIGTAWMLLAVCYSEMQSWSLAIHAFNEAKKLHIPVHSLQIPYFQVAVRALRLLLGELHKEMGETYLDLNADVNAVEEFQKALDCTPGMEKAVQRLEEVKELREAGAKKVSSLFTNNGRLLSAAKGDCGKVQWVWSSHSEVSSDIQPLWEKAAMSWFHPGQQVLWVEAGESLAEYDAASVYASVVLLLSEGIDTQELIDWTTWCSSRAAAGSTLIVYQGQAATESFSAVCSLLEYGIWSLKGQGTLHDPEDGRLNAYKAFQREEIGIHWDCPFYNATGYASEQRHFIESLKPHPYLIKVRAMDAARSVPEPPEEQIGNAYAVFKQPPLVHMQAAPAHLFSMPRAPISIGRTMFETDRIPADWVQVLNTLTEVWVPSQFNFDTFVASGVDPLKLQVVPGVLDERKYSLTSLQRSAIPGARSFAFLSVFDWSIRKGWDLLLRAYLSSFTEEDDVTLVLKVSQINEPNARISQLIEQFTRELQLHSPPHVLVLDARLTEQEMLELYASCHAFVLPTRGEGWGRPYMEAMALEVPVIGTNWSAQLEFMNEQNSYLIDVERLVEVPPSMPAHFKGHMWAEPSIEHLIQLLRDVYRRYDQAKQRAQIGRQSIFPKYSTQSIGRIINRNLERVITQYYETEVYHEQS